MLSRLSRTPDQHLRQYRATITLRMSRANAPRVGLWGFHGFTVSYQTLACRRGTTPPSGSRSGQRRSNPSGRQARECTDDGDLGFEENVAAGAREDDRGVRQISARHAGPPPLLLPRAISTLCIGEAVAD